MQPFTVRSPSCRGGVFFTRQNCSLVHLQVRLPKPVPKPVQQKQKKAEGDKYVCQNKACRGATGRQLQDEEELSKLTRMLHRAEPQQVSAVTCGLSWELSAQCPPCGVDKEETCLKKARSCVMGSSSWHSLPACATGTCGNFEHHWILFSPQN